MKTNYEKHTIEKIGSIAESQDFKIRASAASFQILSSALYSNKIRAICRELCCNAYDSHKAAGKEDVPFEVTLPSSFEPTFIVKDYGTGLSHEDVMTIYTTYFHSTKDDSDEYIGQLGLGSKSPFSYTNQFLVESRFNGILSVYSMFINENGTPAVSLLGSSETEEENGLTIKISVKNIDFYNFKEEISNVLVYFNPYPNVIGEHTRESVEYLIKKETWAIKNDKGNKRNFTPYIVQGFVSYPVDSNQLISYCGSDGVSLSSEGKLILKAPIDFIVPIGLVQVAPSREHLSYDKKTIENLIKFINNVAIEISESIKSIVGDAESLWKARIIASTFMSYDSIFRSLYETLIASKLELKWKDIPISPYGYDLSSFDSFSKNMNVIIHRKIHERNFSRQKMIEVSSYNSTIIDHYKKYRNSHSCFVPVSNNTIVMVNDAYIGPTKIRQYVKDNIEIGGNLIEIKGDDKNIIIKDHIDPLIDSLGFPKEDILFTSDLVNNNIIQKTVRKKSTYTYTGKKPVFNWSGNGHCTHYSWRRETFDTNVGGYYVKFVKSRWVDSYESCRSQTNLKGILDFLVTEKIIDKNTKIYGFNSTDYKKYKNNPNCIDLLSLAEQHIEKKKSYIAIEYAKYLATRSNSYYGQSKNVLDAISKRLPDSHLISKFVKFNNDINDTSWKEYSNLDISGIYGFTNKNLPQELEDEIKKVSIKNNISFKDIYNKYPLIEICMFRIDISEKKLMDHIIAYINNVDSMVEYDSSLDLKVV